MKILFFISVLVAFSINISSVNASRSMPAPVCGIIGKVITDEIRKEPGRGLSQGTTFEYRDITIQLDEVTIEEDQPYLECPESNSTFT
ncbi:MAG: hypothetical protein AAF549_08040, partial [Pseudomonadota bacterium]